MQSLAAYFGLPESAALGWAHAIATEAQLGAACAEAGVHVLAATVRFTEADATPQIGTGPEPAELDVPTFLTRAMLANKAVKLGFADAAAVAPTLGLLRLLKPETPVILHADIFALLSARQPEEALEPDQFVRMVARQLPAAHISLGWSLKRSHDADGRMEEALILQLAQLLTSRLGPFAYTLEIAGGYHPTHNGVAGERGAALILSPLEGLSPAEGHRAPNVVNLLPRLRQVA